MRKGNFKFSCVIPFLFSFLVFITYSSVVHAKNSMDLEVRSGDTLSAIMRTANISYRDTANALDALRKIYDPSNLKVGQKVKVFFDISDDADKQLILQGIEIRPSKLSVIDVSRVGEKTFLAEEIRVPTTKRLVKASAQIESTLFGAAKNAKLPADIRNKFIKNYSYDVDFQRDIRKGNSFEVLYEALFDPNGQIVASGDIVYSAIKLNKDEFKIYRYKTLDGQIDYYDENGQSIKKSFLRTPVDGARITSTFGKRRHPILGYNRMHKGLDFGAPRGTPIYAAGPGIIIEMRRKGSYGNYVKIRHKNGYSTAYAHLSKFNKKLRKNRKVKQGQVIGYVGSTGRSTGPHLHYEVLRNGRQINPLSIKTVSINKLRSLELGIFNQYKGNVNLLAANFENSRHYAKLD